MKRFLSNLAVVLLLAAFTREISTIRASAMQQAACTAPGTWLPTTPLPDFVKPDPHPAPDCPFYLAAWQNFLYSTQPDASGAPRFLTSYTTITALFGPGAAPQFAKAQGRMLTLAPRNAKFPNEKVLAGEVPPTINAGVAQAGVTNGLLIDQNGSPIYYAIHVNDVFSTFLKSKGLTTKDALLNADPDTLEFPQGAVELKSAWEVVDNTKPPSDFYVTSALVPELKIQNGDVVEDGKTRTVTVALIAIHVVFVLKGHPEFVWSTFEHLSANGQGTRDNAPAAAKNPNDTPGASIISNSSWRLFRAGTPKSAANQPNSAQDRVNSFDEAAQRFTKGNIVLQTTVFREFPASKATSTTEDDDVVAANTSMRDRFNGSPLDVKDKRKYYQLVGAVWLDKPDQTFKSNQFFQNADGQSSDDPGAVVAGEDRLSSTAMESFTQEVQPNCFSCHNTRKVTDNSGRKILDPKRLNVSHVISKFLSEAK